MGLGSRLYIKKYFKKKITLTNMNNNNLFIIKDAWLFFNLPYMPNLYLYFAKFQNQIFKMINLF